MRTWPKPPALRSAFADHLASSTPVRPRRQRRPAPAADDSLNPSPGSRSTHARTRLKSLVHREGFEPSYLRGGADLQSAGFNHSPTCAELQNSSAVPVYPAFLADTHATEDGADGLFKTKKKKRANIPSHANTTLGKFLMECRWKNSVQPCRRAAYSAFRNQCWSWRRDLNP
jgi:hypothetical protein